MSKERELLARVLTSELWSVQEELQAEIRELLAEPEQIKRSALTEAVINKELKLSRMSTEWGYGFEAGVDFAEDMHGIVGEE